jgi:flagellar secretion chaperone FliS
MYARAARAYKNVSVESAPPPRVLDELLGRAVADCHEARAKIAAGDRGGKGKAISHAVQICGELIAALDFKAAPELCANLASLYDFIINRLTAANIGSDVAPLAEAEKTLQTLRDAFAQVSG